MRAVAHFCLAFFSTAVSAAASPAPVLRCHDGDTCTAQTEQGTLKIRLAEIAAPEIDQPYGPEAGDVLCSMICDRDVDIEPRGTSYDRVGLLIRVGGLDTREAMVAAAAAWDYARYDTDPAMPRLEAKARAGRLEFWADPAPIPPWTWRQEGMGRLRSR